MPRVYRREIQWQMLTSVMMAARFNVSMANCDVPKRIVAWYRMKGSVAD
jgi:hypothetical protein